MRRPKAGASALSWRGRHWSILALHEGADGVHGASGRGIAPGQSMGSAPDEDDAEMSPEALSEEAAEVEPPVPPNAMFGEEQLAAR